MQCAQIETPVEPIAERCEITCGIFFKVETVVATRETGLEVAQDGVDPFEFGHLLGLASSYDGGW